jgi:beta-glucosidase
VAAANPRTVVVVNAASPVTMDWADDVAAVVQMSYLGQETGAALAAVLFGDADASGRLTTTHPRRIEDCSSHTNFPGADGTVRYDEGVFVGYRHFDAHGIEPRWCFGHGLSYTTFAHSPLSVRHSDAVLAGDAEAHVVVNVDVTNTGLRRGSEVVQLYVGKADSAITRPDQELKGFEKVILDPGETTSVRFVLDRRAFSFWDTESATWRVEPGEHRIMAGSSSRAIKGTVTLSLP